MRRLKKNPPEPVSHLATGSHGSDIMERISMKMQEHSNPDATGSGLEPKRMTRRHKLHQKANDLFVHDMRHNARYRYDKPAPGRQVKAWHSNSIVAFSSFKDSRVGLTCLKF